MPAPLVIPMAENLTTFTNFAEKANLVSENRCRIEVGILEIRQNESLTKMTKEMNELKYELAKMQLSRRKRDSVKEIGRNSPQSKATKAVQSESPLNENEEDIDPKKRTKLGETKAERVENERINNLHRRYSAKLGNDFNKCLAVSLKVRLTHSG